MSCEIGKRLNDSFAAATRALGDYVDYNKQAIKDSAYYAEHERLERTRGESSFAFTEHRDQCTISSNQGAL